MFSAFLISSFFVSRSAGVPFFQTVSEFFSFVFSVFSFRSLAFSISHDIVSLFLLSLIFSSSLVFLFLVLSLSVSLVTVRLSGHVCGLEC